MKRGRKTGAGEKSAAYTPEAMIHGAHPEAWYFSKAVFSMASWFPRIKQDWTPSAFDVMARPSDPDVRAAECRNSLAIQLAQIGKLPDEKAAAFFRNVANLIDSGVRHKGIADLPRLMLLGLTRNGQCFNASELQKQMRYHYGLSVSYRWIHRELSTMGKSARKRGRPRK